MLSKIFPCKSEDTIVIEKLSPTLEEDGYEVINEEKVQRRIIRAPEQSNITVESQDSYHPLALRNGLFLDPEYYWQDTDKFAFNVGLYTYDAVFTFLWRNANHIIKLSISDTKT